MKLYMQLKIRETLTHSHPFRFAMSRDLVTLLTIVLHIHAAHTTHPTTHTPLPTHIPITSDISIARRAITHPPAIHPSNSTHPQLHTPIDPHQRIHNLIPTIPVTLTHAIRTELDGKPRTRRQSGTTLQNVNGNCDTALYLGLLK